MFMDFASAAAKRSACSRDAPHVGAVITDGHGFVTFGYNGPMRGADNYCNAQVGNCGCFHAEANALIKPRPLGLKFIMYVTMSPCETCAGLIVNAGDIVEVVYASVYRSTVGLERLSSAGVLVRCLFPDAPHSLHHF